MCGVSGIYRLSHSHCRSPQDIALDMSEAMTHRGPDGFGVWADQMGNIALAHRRLAIIDLSEDGHQPMTSRSGRFILSYNGEIYNYREIRSVLVQIGHNFLGRSDTEVLICAIEEWGVWDAVHRLNGMFAFAVWDRAKATLYLVRDRFGEKPIYYGWIGNDFAFASELKAFKRHEGFSSRLDRAAVGAYIEYGYVPSPASIYEGINKLPSGSVLTLQGNDRDAAPVKYWDLASSSQGHNQQGSEQTITNNLHKLLSDAVNIRTQADVPIGAFLSGGIDSSLVVALMQSQSSNRIKTFSIGFQEADFNEALYAKKVANHLGTDHTELYVSAHDAINVIPILPIVYDEPFADSSQIPTYLVSKLARGDVTVSLSGDGADELFGGYSHYRRLHRSLLLTNLLPMAAKKSICRLLHSLSETTLDQLLLRLISVLPRSFHIAAPGDKIRKFGRIISASSEEDLYRSVAIAIQQQAIMSDAQGILLSGYSKQQDSTDLPIIKRLMLLDTTRYLPDDILVKVERASMAVSLESRAPFLDHRVAEFAWGMPLDFHFRNSVGKFTLCEILKQYVPQALIDRPKKGFSIPLSAWLRKEMREWSEDLIEEASLKQQGIFNVKQVQAKWIEHLSERRNWHTLLWNILMFQQWYYHVKTTS